MGFQVLAIMGVFIIPVIIAIFMSKRSKKAAMIWLSIPFLFVIGVLLWWVYEINDRFIADTDLATEEIEPFELFEPKDEEALQTYGEFEEDEENPVFEDMYEYDEFSLGFELDIDGEEQLTYIEIRKKGYETTRGLQVGDSIERVEELYGTDTYTSNETGIGVSKNYVDRKSDRHIKFFETDGVISQITFYKR